MKRILVVLLVLALSMATPAHAQWVVFDPTNFGVALEHLTELVQQYSQMIQTYQQIRAQYNHSVWMAQRLSPSVLLRYRALANTWRSLSAPNTYDTLTPQLT